MSEKLPFEKIFPYFSYRWRYNDGQFSPYAPFSKVAFLPKDPNVEDFFRRGHNTAVANKLEQITLKDIDRGGPDVEAVDILYTESISSTIYVLKTIEIPEAERGNGSPLTVQLKERSFGAALPSTQLTRQFDSVPKSAKAQEVTANRVIYGNYISKYNQNDNLKIELSTAVFPDPLNGPSLKGNRTYEVGVAYMDRFGRIGGMLTQKAPDTAVEGSSIKTAFTQRFRTGLTAKITSDPPEWAKFYRYYVKDVSGEHFNLSAFNIYNDGTVHDTESDNVYLQFNSTDRNKITEDTVLIPRRHTFERKLNGAAVETLFAGESRHPVLGIENDAPDVVKGQVTERKVVPIATFLEEQHDIFDGNASNGATGINKVTLNAGATTFVVDDEDKGGMGIIVSQLNNYFASQDNSAAVFTPLKGDTSSGAQTQNCTAFPDRLALKFKGRGNGNNQFDSDLVLVDSVSFIRFNGEDRRNGLKFTVSSRVDEDGMTIAGTGISTGNADLDSSGGPTHDLKLFKLGLSTDGENKLKGSFFVKVPRLFSTTATIVASGTGLIAGQTPFKNDGNVKSNEIKEANFETEPGPDSNLDLYFEGNRTYEVRDDDGNITEHGQLNTVEFANCIATAEDTSKEVYLESRKLFDKFNTIELAKGIRVNTPDPRYAEENRKTGLIFSGLYNSKTGTNNLNQFDLSTGITKELEPNYGGIQKLYTLDTNLLALAEDKVFRILADKDALFNADDGVNVTATNLVLGQAMAYQGNYGISTHPESFVYFRNNVYFSDAKRGSIVQLSPANGQMFPISSKGMSNFFRDRLSALQTTTATDNDGNVFNTAKILGLYDGHKKNYVVSIQGYNQSDASIGSESIPNETSNITLSYSLNSQGWTTRYSFIPETGISMNNRFFTFKDGKAYLHHSNTANRNNFYGVAGNSEVQVIFNDNPSFVSDWLSLNYEGTTGWLASEILGEQDSTYSITNVRLLDSEDSNFDGWFLKEGKYYGSIVGTQPVYIIQPGSSIGADGFYPLIQDGSNTQDISGTKGFFLKARFKNTSTSVCELAAVGSEYYISQT
tara:strand:+ start:6682 stop:9852 length:3171 start_codon:yes stop_codon:yes gene_type:complete